MRLLSSINLQHDFPINTPSFKLYLFKPSTIIYTISAFTCIIGLWILFKHYYIYPNITYDSYYYIDAAVSNVDVSFWPIGYSKYIRLIGLISHNANFLVFSQYFILELSLLYFFISTRFIFNLSIPSSCILFIFLFINPAFIYGSNHILSDFLFTGLSTIWSTLLLWVIYRPRTYLLYLQAFLLIIIFTIRYNALYYPIILFVALVLTQLPLTQKVISFFFTCFLLGSFIIFTSWKMKELTGVWQFSHTSGWKNASNALYLYENVYKNDHSPIPQKFQGVDKMVRKYFDQPHEQVDLFHVDISAGSYYKSVGWSPLMLYMDSLYNKNDIPFFNQLSLIAPLYNEYGSYIIKNHPLAFLKYVVLPCTEIYLIPWHEIYTINYPAFLIWKDGLGISAQKWFGLNTLLIPLKYVQLRESIMAPFPLIFTMIHLIFVLSLISFLSLKGYKRLKRIYIYTLSPLVLTCFINFIFFILLAPSVLRFQLPIIVLELLCSLVFLEFLLLSESKKYSLGKFNEKLDALSQ